MGIFRQFPYSNFHDMNMDQIIKIMREMQDEWAVTKTEWASYKDFIDNYFATLDVSEEVLAALRVFAADGTLNQIMDPTIATETAAWLAEHITPTTPAVDSSLTVAGAAADAKVTGDTLREVNDYLSDIIDRVREQQDISNLSLNDCYIEGSYIRTDGAVGSSPNYKRSGFIKVSQNDTIHYSLTGGVALIAFFTDADLSTYQLSNSVIGDGTLKTGDYIAPSDGYIIISLNLTNANPVIRYVGPTNYGINHIVSSYTSYVGTSGNRDEIKVIPNGTGLKINVPNRIQIVGRAHTVYSMDFADAQEILLPHNSLLLVDMTNSTLKTVTYDNLAAVDYEYIILAYANNGRCLGQWSRYYYNNQAENDRRLIKSLASWVGTSGNRPEIKIVKNGTGIDIYIPNRLLYIYNGSVPAWDDSAQVINLAHNDVLYFDIDNQTLATISVYNLSTLTVNYIILAYCNNGRCLGQWRRYQIDNIGSVYLSQASFHTIELCSRQGEIEGCPENSLIGAKTARQSGYDRVRISVQVTSDGIPVCYHDANLGMGKLYKNGIVVTDTSLTIHDLTYAQLQDYDYGAYKGAEYVGTKIETLDAHAHQSKLMGYAIDVEIKENVTALTNSELTAIFNVIAKYGLIGITNFRLYNLTSAQLYVSITPKANVGIIAFANAVDLDALSGLNTDQNKIWWFTYPADDTNITDAMIIEARTKDVNIMTGVPSAADFKDMCAKYDMVEYNLSFPTQYLL